MQSTNIRQMKAALWNQAFLGKTLVICPMGSVVAERRAKGAAPGNDPRVGTLVQY
jgi:hypothetical protein